MQVGWRGEGEGIRTHPATSDSHFYVVRSLVKNSGVFDPDDFIYVIPPLHDVPTDDDLPSRLLLTLIFRFPYFHNPFIQFVYNVHRWSCGANASVQAAVMCQALRPQISGFQWAQATARPGLWHGSYARRRSDICDSQSCLQTFLDQRLLGAAGGGGRKGIEKPKAIDNLPVFDTKAPKSLNSFDTMTQISRSFWFSFSTLI